MAIPFDPMMVTAFFLALVRASAWLFVAPPFNSRLVPIPVKMGIAASLALAAAPHVAEPNLPLETGAFFGALITQVAVGLTIGFVTMLLVNAIGAAGSLVDLFAGYSIAQLYDPMADTSAAVFGRFYQLLAVTLLFSTNAYLLLVNGFLRSFEVVPAEGIGLETVAAMFTKNLGMFLVAALEVAGPVLACLFLSEMVLGLLSRAAPNLNVFSLAFPLRVIVALLVVAVALPLIAPALSNLVQQAVTPFGG